MNPDVKTFFDETTFTATHLVVDPNTNKAVIIDPVLDFDAASGRSGTKSADEILHYVATNKIEVLWVLETHVHADHISAAVYLKEKLGCSIGIGDQVPVIQKTFGEVFNAESNFRSDGSQFDALFADGQTLQLGSIDGKVLHTPGHTPACVTYVFGDAGFVGDTMFMPDYGSARCDFPGGDARTLYRSIQKIFALPKDTRLFMCHDYKAPGRDDFSWITSVGEQREKNIHLANTTEDAFVKMRETRDATLNMPKLILPSVQVNMRAGAFPPPESNGTQYLKLPVNAL